MAPTHPRGIKRIVNQYRLCKILGTESGDFAPAETAFLLNFSGGFRLAARRLVDELRMHSPPDGETLQTLLKEVADVRQEEIKQKLAGGAANADLSPRSDPLLKELRVLFDIMSTHADEVPRPAEIRKILRTVVPFCFIGDLAGPLR